MYKFLPVKLVQRLSMRHCARFYADRSYCSRDMAIFRFFKMAAVCHLVFLKVTNFTCWASLRVQYASFCQILCQSIKPCQRLADFRFSRWRPSAILDFKNWKFYLPGRFGVPIWVIIPNFVPIGQTILEIWPSFWFSRWRPFAILDFKSSKF